VSPEGSRPRHVYLDWARGIAVLLMLGWHTADAWTRPADRHLSSFGWAVVLGGLAAPLFLWLAGLGVALSATRRAARGTDPGAVAAAICRRGLEIFVLAFLFRLQAFIVSPGNQAISIFRVDILNVMGPAVVLAGFIWALGPSIRARVAWYGALAVAIAILTPFIRTTAIVDVLPDWMQWYSRPSGNLTTFTLFPWAGFVLAGAACGAVLAVADDNRSERRTQLVLAAVGAVLVTLVRHLSTQPGLSGESRFWIDPLIWFAMRLGIVMVGAAAIHAMAEIAARRDVRCPPLERFGRSSLFVYWIHVELVYGYASWPLHDRLPLWGVGVALMGFSTLMYGAVVMRDRVVATWRARATPRVARQAAQAPAASG
jgi:uncharacterized membrane protein